MSKQSHKYRLSRIFIAGMRTPHLYLYGRAECRQYRIIVKSDQGTICEIKNAVAFDEPRNVEFFRDIIIGKNDKKIQVISYIDSKKQKTIIKHNNILLRTIAKAVSIPTNLLRKIFSSVSNKLSKSGDLNDRRAYRQWIKLNEKIKPEKDLKYNPLSSLVIPVYDAPKEFFDECIKSILDQTYQNFEICLADDASPSEHVKPMLQEYEKLDKRIKVVYCEKNGGISTATNAALEVAKGEFVGLIDNDDTLSQNALYEVAKALNKNRDLDFIYSDEDKLDLKGKRCDPHFKPDWSPDTLLGANYITHFSVLRKSILNKIGGPRTEYNGAQDHELFLRFTEQTTADKIYHIPKILYHWRMSPTSTALNGASKPYAALAGQRAIQDTLKRRNIKAEVSINEGTTTYVVRYHDDSKDLVSIIIPTKDNPIVLKRCVDSIKKFTKRKYELIIINNNSEKEESFKYYTKLEKEGIKVLTINEPFNYSRLNNEAAKQAKGKYLLFLNDDTEVTHGGWLNDLLGYASQKHIGVVGAKLLYPSGEIQHAGVVLGIGGIAGHAFSGLPGDYLAPYFRLMVPYNYSAVTGACLMIEKKKFNQIGGFDEKLAVAFNDVDLCIKSIQAGYYNVLVPFVTLIHHESLSRGSDTVSKEKIERFGSEVTRMQDKWGELLFSDPFYNPAFSLENPFRIRLD